MRKKLTTTLKIALVDGTSDSGKEICKYINLAVNPDLTDDDVMTAGQIISGLQYLPLHHVERLDTCDLTE